MHGVENYNILYDVEMDYARPTKSKFSFYDASHELHLYVMQ